jgi:hypothetical protein
MPFFFVPTDYILPLLSLKTNHENKVLNPIRIDLLHADSNDVDGTERHTQRKCE